MIFDLHNDLPTSELSSQERRLEALSVNDTVIYAFWTTELENPLSYIRSGKADCLIYDGMFGVEDIGFTNENNIDELLSLLPVYCSLTHNKANRYAGGALQNGELTPKGKDVIHKLNRYGIALDIAHLSHESILQAVDSAERVIDTHTGLTDYCAHPRNLTDEEVRAVLDKGGIIGLTAVADFIDSTDYKAYVRLIDSFVQKYGIDGASIGTDFHGTKPLMGLEFYEDFDRVEYMLENYGYGYDDIHKIFYDNANNYFKYRRNKFK